MKKKIVLISCVSKKETEACKAKDMYVSPLFKMSWEYAKQFSPDAVFILSDKYHLLDPEQQIAPYDEVLTKSAQWKKWAGTVLYGLEEKLKEKGIRLEQAEFIILAGEKYWKHLRGENGIRECQLPLRGLGGIGCILHFLKEKTSK